MLVLYNEQMSLQPLSKVILAELVRAYSAEISAILLTFFYLAHG